MPIDFAQHAYCGEFHLETRYLGPKKWHWQVLRRKQKPGVSGITETLDEAKAAAIAVAGVRADEVKWRDIGPRINAEA
jgi:hypothetical protein